MKIKKSIQTRVHIQDPSLLYSGNIDTVIMDNLKQRFEGHCYMSCLIVEIIGIQNRSNFIFSKHRQDGSATCNVRFTVFGIVIKKYEMLHECVVKKIDKDGHIICKNKHAAIYIKVSKALQSIKEDQTIVALAGAVKYKIFKPAISINALPFIPMKNISSLVIYNVIVKHPTGIIKKMIKDLDAEIKNNKSLPPDVHSFFMKLIYPYKSNDKLNELKKKATVQSLHDIANLPNNKQLYISQPDILPRDKPVAAVYNTVDSKDLLNHQELQRTPGGIITTEGYETIVGYMIHIHIEHQIMIRQLCTTYNTMELVKKNGNLWDIYTRNRIA